MTRIALLSDTHISCNIDAQQVLFRQRLEAAVAAVNAASVDLALFAGDLVDGGKPEESVEALRLIQPLQSPVRFVPGNHDVGNKPLPGDQHEVREEWLAQYEETVDSSFFDETMSGLRLVGMNASILGSGLIREDEQWAFLEQAMTRPAVDPCILLVHYPPFLESPGEAADYWNVSPPHRERLLALCKTGGVIAALSGHTHRAILNHYGGITLITTPPISLGLPKGEGRAGWTLITVSPAREVSVKVQWLE